jgi:hypothetical protein
MTTHLLRRNGDQREMLWNLHLCNVNKPLSFVLGCD